ncbi:MAG: 5'-nucleotidase C-terminal domain-containing protein [Erysipelotrichaceae bacterium]|nr:5'-nucleotidase C-terminal domain-containing protein [Erysipelotrichaceae bacterium]
MKLIFKKIFVPALSLALIFSCGGCSAGAQGVKTIRKEPGSGSGRYAGKTVILHSNDVHGAVEGYAKIAGFKNRIQAEGGTPVLVDAGDFSNGTAYVSVSQGENAVQLMNASGYDIAGVGNHEFDFGFEKLKSNMDQASFTVVCSNLFRDGKTVFDSEAVVQAGNLKIGFFGLVTPETKTKVMPSAVRNLTFAEKEEMYQTAQKEVDLLRQQSDVVICVSHLGTEEESKGNRSTDLIDHVKGIDAVIDAHSHQVVSENRSGVLLQSAGTGFEKIGAVVIDNKTGEMTGELEEPDQIASDAAVKAKTDEVIRNVDAALAKTLAKTDFELNGKKEDVRTGETNLGNLAADALKWKAETEFSLKTDKDHLIGLMAGGGIRSSLKEGEITLKALKDALPYSNKLTVVYVTGSELLETLEAAAFRAPELAASFPQVSGLVFEVDTGKPYQPGSKYPNSDYYAPKTISRVKISSVNGKPFDEKAVYGIATTDFYASGGDTYGALVKAFEGKDVQISQRGMDDAAADYLEKGLNGTMPEEYRTVQHRITVK